MHTKTRRLSPGTNSYTGKIMQSVDRRLQNAKRHPNLRAPILHRVLSDGAAWGPKTAQLLDRLCAVEKRMRQKEAPNKMQQKRLGVKRVKTLEKLDVAGEVLGKEDAKLYRALAARAKYLALDRPDLSCASKELLQGRWPSHETQYLKTSWLGSVSTGGFQARLSR